jgi:HlyD family secretion protein
MNKKRALRIVIPIVLLLVAAGIYWLVVSQREDQQDVFTVSGTIEAVTSSISPEIGGKVTTILVAEGDSVNIGDRLFLIDDSLLQAQQKVANANLLLAQKSVETANYAVATARINYDMIAAAARQESASVRAADWKTSNLQGYTLPGGSFTPQELIEAARSEVDAALSDREEAAKNLEELLTDSDNTDFVAAEEALLKSMYETQSARDVLTKASTSGNSDLKDEAQIAYDNALDRLEKAQDDYDELKDRDGSQKILTARNSLIVATERVQAAEVRLSALQTGENSLKALAAQATLAQAQAAADQASQSVLQAQANLDLLDTQIGKLTVLAPVDGIVLSKSVETGEVLAAGAQALTIGQLDPLTITVYVPESRIGLLSVNQQATLQVDSFPDEEFSATIIAISDEAEFTPRNVQTVEGRKTTVFAVKLQLSNPEGKLKPGMPADVLFDVSGQ